ncbi:MAG TPA: anaerobic sulfatase maturase [Desulfomonilia bacterium]|nr:anaerobic sulfatase maturase [Desulfomonilia bacterium]
MRPLPTPISRMQQRELTSILIKPAGPDCNMACTYCFYSGKKDLFADSRKHRMSGEVLAEMIRQFLGQAGSEAIFTWQGGEPTLMGLEFFQHAVELQQRYGCGLTVGNAFQTNGLLLDKKWASFLRKYRFLVGLSIDGPAHVHDRYRRDHSGRGTRARVADRAKLLLDSGVEVNALAVVNDYSVRFAEEIYSSFKDLGLTHMQFTPCVEMIGGHEVTLAPFSTGSEDYGRFLCTLFDLWIGDFRDGLPTTSIRLFESLLFSFAGMQPPQCTLARTCGDYVVVEHNGGVYACDFFVAPQWRLGDIMTESLSRMFDSARRREFGECKADLPALCRGCVYLACCNGGCPKDRIRTGGRVRMNHLCKGTMIFLDHAGEKMQELVRKSLQRRRETVEKGLPGGAARCGARGPGTRRAPIPGMRPEEKPGRNDPCPCGSGIKYKKCCGK